MSQLFDNNPYQSQPNYGYHQSNDLQFYNSGADTHFYPSGSAGNVASGLEGHMGSSSAEAHGTMQGQIQGRLLSQSVVELKTRTGGFWSAFTPNAYADEPPLLQGWSTACLFAMLIAA